MSDERSSTYYFLHIPKTGGTSLTAILDRFFDVDDIFPAQLWWDVGNVKKVKDTNYQFIRGHFGYGAKILSHNQLNTLTMFRDPLSLIHSTYQYIKRESKTNVHDFVISQGLSFDEFLTHDRTRNLVSNRLIKSVLMSLGAELNAEDLTMTAENYKSYKKQWNKKKKLLTNQQLLDKAKAYIEGFLWFGLIDYFDASLQMLCYQMCWPPLGVTQKLNSHNQSTAITAASKIKVKELNSLDFELYEFVEQAFKKRLSQFYLDIGVNECDDAEVEGIIDANYQNNYLKENGLKLLEEFKYDFSMVLLGQNWHQREWNAKENCYFRWTGPQDRTIIDFWMLPGCYLVTFYLIDFINKNIFEGLEVFINNQSIDWQSDKMNNYQQISFRIDSSLIKENGLTRIAFASKVNEVHDNKYHSGDKRRVGFAVKHIVFSKA
jgi:hypothetical protein